MEIRTKIWINAILSMVQSVFIIVIPSLIIVNNFTLQEDVYYLLIVILMIVAYWYFIYRNFKISIELKDEVLIIRTIMSRKTRVLNFNDYNKDTPLNYWVDVLGTYVFQTLEGEFCLHTRLYNRNRVSLLLQELENKSIVHTKDRPKYLS
jgi:hypothetical protein